MGTAEELGERLRSLRRLPRLTQQELADLTGVSKSLVSKVEAGQRPGSWDLAVKVAGALGIDAVALMGLPPGTTGEAGRIAACLPSLRQVFAGHDFRPRPLGPPRSLRQLAHDVDRAGLVALHHLDLA